MSTQNHRKPFKPPRPITSSSTGFRSAQADQRKGNNQERQEPLSSPSASEPEMRQGVAQNTREKSLDTVDSDDMSVEEQPAAKQKLAAADTPPGPIIAPKLLSALLHEHFNHDDTRITKDAMTVFRKYIELFVMEAVGRANEERDAAALQTSKSSSKAHQTSSDFLEVEDLEKLAPQLLLDF